MYLLIGDCSFLHRANENRAGPERSRSLGHVKASSDAQEVGFDCLRHSLSSQNLWAQSRQRSDPMRTHRQENPVPELLPSTARPTRPLVPSSQQRLLHSKSSLSA